MTKILRTLSDPDFNTKGNTLTWEELDNDLIEIWDATLDGKGVTATAAELNRLDGTLSTVQSNLGLKDGSADLDLNSLDINGSAFVDASRNVTGGTADFSGSLDANTLRTDTGKFLSPTDYQFRNAGDSGYRDVTMASLTATESSNPDVSFVNTGDTSANRGVSLNFDHSNATGAQINALRQSGNSSGMALRFFTESAGATLAEHGRFSSEGRFILGDTTATRQFEIAGDNARMRIRSSNTSNYSAIDFVADNRRFDIGVGGSAVGVSDLQDSFFISDDTAGVTRFMIDSGGTASFSNDVQWLAGNAETDNFASGWAGTGWQGAYSGDWEMRNLRVTGALRVYEFIAKQLASIGGTEILSIANAKIQSVDTVNNIITVDNVSGTARTPFKPDDTWIVQVVDINNDLESGGTGSIVYSVRGVVLNTASSDASLDGDQIEVSVSGGSPDGLDALEEQDLIVAYGNISDPDRQAIMYRNVDRSEDNLIMRLQTGVNNFTALQSPDNTRVAYGDINGYADFSSETFGFFAGDNTSDKITIDATNGVRFLDASDNVTAKFNNNKLIVGDGFEYDAPSNTLNVGGFTVNATEIRGGELRIRKDRNTIEAFESGASGAEVKGIYFGETWFNFSAGQAESDMGITVVDANNDIPFQATTSNRQIGGAFFDGSGIWMGGAATSDPSTKSDANIWIDGLNGRLYYDALIVPIYTRTETAALNTVNPSPASSVDDDEWRIEVSTAGASSTYQTNSTDIINANYPHRFGIDNIQIIGLLNDIIVGAGDEGRCRIQISIDGNTQTNTVYTLDNTAGGSSTSDSNISIDESFDISGYSLTPNTVYEVTIAILSEVRSPNTGSMVCQSQVNENLIVLGTTD